MPRPRKTAINATNANSRRHKPIPSVATSSTSRSTCGSSTSDDSPVPTIILTEGATSAIGGEPTPIVRRSTRSRITASQGTASVATLSSSLSKGKAKEDGKQKPKYLPLGPPHLEARYSAAIADLRTATCRAFYALCPREYLIRPLDSLAVRNRKKELQPGVEDIKNAGFADVDRARKKVEEIDRLLDEAIERRRLEQGGDGGWTEEEEEIEPQVTTDTKEDEALARDFLLEMAKWKRLLLALAERNAAATSKGIGTNIHSAHDGARINNLGTKSDSKKRKAGHIEDRAAPLPGLQNIDQNSPPGKRYNTRKRKHVEC
jgi:hypothetical protein